MPKPRLILIITHQQRHELPPPRGTGIEELLKGEGTPVSTGHPPAATDAFRVRGDSSSTTDRSLFFISVETS